MWDKKKMKNSFMSSSLTEKLFPGKQNKNGTSHEFDDNSIGKLKSLSHLPRIPKVKETHSPNYEQNFENFLGYVSTLMTMFVCSLKNDIETMDHNFFLCDVTHTFLAEIHKWIAEKISSLPTSISKDDVTFGMMLKKQNNELCINCTDSVSCKVLFTQKEILKAMCYLFCE